jgi:hypothetical protein
MPAHLKLEEFGSHIWFAFGEPAYHVGSSFMEKSGWRDVDVRLILSDDEYEAQGFGDPNYANENGKWVALVLAFSALGREMTGLPIDFQIQQATRTKILYGKLDKEVIGRIPLRVNRVERGQP